MKIIAHRGNLDGISVENKPAELHRALNMGFDVEVDVWRMDGGQLFLGHNTPLYPIDLQFLEQKGFWVHAKNLSALKYLKQFPARINVFYHANDTFTLTSQGHIWTAAMGFYDSSCVLVSNDISIIEKPPYALCTDYPIAFSKIT